MKLAAAAVMISAGVASGDDGPFRLFGTHTTGSPAQWGLVEFETDPITGVNHPIGADGLSFDGDFSPDGTLFAPEGLGPRFEFGLVTWDLQTGEQTFIGEWNLGEDVLMESIAFAPDGSLYGTGFFLNSFDQGVFEIDPLSGQATELFRTTIFLSSMDFAPDGTLWGAGAAGIFTIDLDSGHTSRPIRIGPFLTSLDIDFRGVARGIDFNDGASDLLYEVDLDEASATLVGNTTREISGLATVPAPGTLAVLMLAMAGRRRGRSSARRV